MAQTRRFNILAPIPMDEAGDADRADHSPERFMRAEFLPPVDTPFRTQARGDLRTLATVAGSHPDNLHSYASGADLVT